MRWQGGLGQARIGRGLGSLDGNGWEPPPTLDPHFININIESSLSKWLDSLILLEGEVLYSLNGFY